MQPDNAAHLTPEQILQVANGRLQDQIGIAHVEVCPVCRNEVTKWREWLEVWTVTGERTSALREPGDECPEPEAIASLLIGATGELSEEELSHVAGCDRCGALLRDAMNREEPTAEEREFISTLHTASADWRHRMAVRYSTPVMPVRSAPRPSTWWLALAAATIASIGLIAWWGISRASQPERLLAKAYTANRPFEYRLPDAGYAPVRQQRSAGGSTFDNPADLTTAVEQLQRRLTGGKENGPDLFLKGRAELLESQYDPAIESLTRGLELQAQDPAALADLACAYALRGDVEKRNLDYGHAIELFAQSLRINPAQPRAIYNSALVYQRLWLVDEAIDAWDRYLKLDPAGEWAAEAMERRAELEKIRSRKKAAMELPKDPAGFLARLRKSPGEVEPELYVDGFWSEWMPEVRDHAGTREAAEELGRVFVERFHDESLRDAVRDALAVDATAELSGLAKVLTESSRERSDVAVAQELKLIPALASKRQFAARMRAVDELGYDYSRAADHASCLQTIDLGLHEMAAKSYPWLNLQMRLQHSACDSLAASFGAASAQAEAVRRDSESTGFRYLSLKSVSFLTNVDQRSGNPESVWDLAPGGLARYWDTGASHFRAQQFIYDLQKTAIGMGWKESGIILDRAVIRAAVRATADSKNRIIESLDRVNLSALLEDSGHAGEALGELDTADGLLRAAEPGPAVNAAKFEAMLERAAIEATGPSAPNALRMLSGVSVIPDSAGILERMRFYQARGLAQKAGGRYREAEDSFREAIRLHRMNLNSIPKPAARLGDAALGRDSYRNLAELQMIADRDPAGALRTWELYRSQLDGRTYPDDSMTPAKPGAVAVVYAVLPSGVAVWLRDATATQGRMIETPANEIEREARDFVRMTASPSSSLRDLAATSRRLHHLLLGGYATRIPPGARLYIDADDWLAPIPFGALMDESGNYLMARNAIMMTSAVTASLRPPLAAGDSEAFSPRERALIVSVAAPRSPAGTLLPAIEAARDEAVQLQSRMRGAILLSDAQASSDAIAREIPHSTMFHFAGHGWANGGNGALLLGASGDGATGDSAPWIGSDELASQDWSSCRLAVLSACLTGAGEERGPVNSRSLVRAFLAAGAQRVIAARWSVDAAATEALMKEFYDRLFAGARPAEALAAAELRIATTAGWSHPYFWAGFDLFGV